MIVMTPSKSAAEIEAELNAIRAAGDRVLASARGRKRLLKLIGLKPSEDGRLREKAEPKRPSTH